MNNLEIGIKYLKEGNTEQAEHFLNLAINENSQNADAFYNRGKVNRMKGDLIAALNDFHKAYDIDPKHCEAKVSIDMINSIISFRNPDLLNH
ncbi:MAG TPA: hypothetical protein DIW31_10195 [Bacteroidales bacterium]|nr:hypothetical protein [Bacteroidales bacterium]